VTIQKADGTWSFSVPRNFYGGTVIGGTKDVNDWNPHPDPAVRAQLLSNFKAYYPKVLGENEEFTIIRDIVGRRPARQGGMRLEPELVADGKTIVHAYGLGGRGFELSWGVAEAVHALLTGESTNIVDITPQAS
jgi:D-amino-acid oxidase